RYRGDRGHSQATICSRPSARDFRDGALGTPLAVEGESGDRREAASPPSPQETAMADTKILLHERDMPRSWYNVLADAPSPPQPPLHPGTGQPIGPDDLAPLF